MKRAKHPTPSTSLPDFLDVDGDKTFRKLVSNLIQMSSAMLATRERYAALIGVTPPQYSLLAAVADAGETTVGQLANDLDVSGPFVTLQVNKLVKSGFLSRRQNDEDKRSSIICLTDSGVAALAKVAPVRKLANDIIFAPFRGGEAAQLRTTVDRLLVQMRLALHELDRPGDE